MLKSKPAFIKPKIKLLRILFICMSQRRHSIPILKQGSQILAYVQSDRENIDKLKSFKNKEI